MSEANFKDGSLIGQGVFWMQVCVPNTWSNSEVRSFAIDIEMKDDPSWMEHMPSRWKILRKNGVGRVPCDEKDGFCHIVLNC